MYVCTYVVVVVVQINRRFEDMYVPLRTRAFIRSSLDFFTPLLTQICTHFEKVSQLKRVRHRRMRAQYTRSCEASFLKGWLDW